MLLGILCPMDMDAVGCRVAFKHFKIIAETADGVPFHAACHFAQSLPLRDALCHPVPLFADEIKRLVVPCRTFAVGNEFFGCFSV